MKDNSKKPTEDYQGFEQGPIRPPSEAASLLIRVTRNCPWNRCTFCPVYKGEKFSLRPVEHVIRDIDTVHRFVTLLQDSFGSGFTTADLSPLAKDLDMGERMALSSAVNWIRGGKKSIFLQDANSLIIKPDNLIRILSYLQKLFPQVERITSYARSHTIRRIEDEKLAEMRAAGLNRIHIGMESGSDKVLKLVKKGSTKEDHITAGLKVKKAGMELSEYVMPGLGGRELSRDHALETADALNTINADFIRLRSLAIPDHVELFQLYSAGKFSKQTDKEIAAEILLFLQQLEGVTSTLKSDHILNLFEEVQGVFPEDKERMTTIVETFLRLPPHEQMLFQVGRRTGVLSRLADLKDPGKRAMAEAGCARFQISPENVDSAVDELMKRFI
ncbi:radical SAM protein [Desulfopila inferna]|uniref:radical SAM protein n=1 Tax=Desulfopila inferna TaxID=468528 RepID=UPI001962BB0E|nr:radical SAM protein [Desulfopila inferna]MBM9606582.1 radical SAM protein [Desulfopila inferna]